MAKTNLYVTTVLERRNVVIDFFNQLFLVFASYPRLIAEVFIRKNFGERYFKLSTALTIVAILLAIPSVSDFMYGGFFGSTIDAYSWYMFIALFLGYSVKHWYNTLRTPGVFDFCRFSKYSGNIHPGFYALGFCGQQPNERTIETILEPLLFFMIGLVLHWVGFNLGMLLIVVSLFYSLGYFAAYKQGDDFILNLNDHRLFIEYLQSSFVKGLYAEETAGVRYRMRKPKLFADRQALAEAMVHDPSKVEFTLAE